MKDANISRARPFNWLWTDRVLLGYLNLMIGEEGAGKSTFVCWLAARTTKGELPGTLDGKPRRIVIIGDEDSWDNVWVPRLHVAGADMGLAKNIVGDGDGDGIDITDAAQMRDLQDYIRAENIKLVFFDQMLDNLGYTDSWKDKQVRAAFAPLRSVAAKTNTAVLFSMHPNKRGGSFRQRVSGTPAFNALSRSSLLVAHHPIEPDRRVVVRAKGNYAAEPPAFEFDIVQRAVGRRKIVTTQIDRIAETSLTAADVLDAALGRRRVDSKASIAKAAILEALADGAQHPSKEAQAQILREHPELSESAVRKAAVELGVSDGKVGFKEGWMWRLPSAK